jgi:hypothetical protein
LKISEFLSEGAQGAKTARELRETLHLKDYELRELVRRERLDGEPICSRMHTDDDGKAGYFLPKDAADYQTTIKHLRSREREIRTVRKALEKAYLTRYGE